MMIYLVKCYGLNQLRYCQMLINKDTKIYASFSNNPGNNGCLFFNKKFKKHKINAIYKSFYSDNLKKSIEAVKSLNISGFALSSPFKVEILNYVDEIDDVCLEIGSANTVINLNGYLKAYNTDWVGVEKFLRYNFNHLTILGDGGFSKSVQYVCKQKKISFDLITRKNWDLLNDVHGSIFNATPIEVKTSSILIDARPFTIEGKKIAKLQAEEQFKIYTKI